ncbi:MAG: hypothetical protein DRN01_01410 [Thermoplasmata archaeon]|nr:MAG: hypothetical protein DRN01_01410 [Thermoplasmata archaeon]
MLSKILDEKERLFGAVILITAGVLGRIYLRGFLPNTPSWYITLNGVTQPVFMMDLFFVVAAISLLSGLLLGGYYTFIVPLSTMIITDLYYGNTYIFLFTWSGFVMLGLLGFILQSKTKLSLKKTPLILGVGVGGVLLYDLWTNFGCWLGWYPHNLSGLALCYTVAIPFTLWHILSTTMILSATIIPILYLKEHGILKIEHTIKPLEKTLTAVLSAALIMITPLFLFL